MRFIKNEWIKLWNQRSTWIMLIISIAIVVGISGLNKYFSDDNSTEEARVAAIEEDIANMEEILASEGESEYTDMYREEMALLQYRLEHGLPSQNTMSIEESIDFNVSFLLSLAGIFTMVVAASIVSNEFSTGTIKMLLTRPVARWKILLSKLVTSILFGIALFAISSLIGVIISYILFDTNSTVQVIMVEGQIVENVVEYTTANTVLYGFLSTLMTVFFAFMLGSIFGSSTLAVSLALGIMFFGSTLSMFLAQYDFAKYIWFVNNLSQYAKGAMPIIEDLTFGFSLTVNIVYAVIFLGISFLYFTRRDVTA